MKVEETPLAGAYVIEPRVFGDERGFFYESYQKDRYRDTGIKADFVQDNHSRSLKGVLRGMHYQRSVPQAQLVYVTHGSIYDVIVDLRAGSPTFGRWYGVILSGDVPKQLFMPFGFAHGFYTLSDFADFHYKVTEFYHPHDEGGVHWDDPTLGIMWPSGERIVNKRDQGWPYLKDMTAADLPETGIAGDI
jgi:dTDP-4-dehydrorhamnose 3,5-epimerase